MSGAVATPTPTRARNAPASAALPSRHAALWALTRVEGRRLLTHPLFALGIAVSVLLLGVASSDGGDGLFMLAGGCFTFVGGAVWMFLVACLAASRERRDAAQDFYGAQPLSPRVRTEAALLSLGWAGLAGAALIVVAAVVLAGFDGALVVEGERYALRPLELAQGPVYLVMVGALGVLVGSWTRRAYPAVLGALVLFLPPVAWLPWFVFGDGVPQGFYSDWLVGASVGWHLIGLAGLAAFAAAGALARHDRRPRVALLALAGFGAAVAGVALGSPTGY